MTDAAPSFPATDPGPATPDLAEDDLADLIACPRCDLLHRARPVRAGCTARCTRCHAALIAPRGQAVPRVVALSLTVLILMVGAVFFPFLQLEAGGFTSSASLLDAATAFHDGWLLPLSGLVAAFIVLLPALRVAALIYALTPIALGQPAPRHGAMAMRVANRIKPWAMAEIFILGVIVALVKISDLATVTPGPAFWAFCALVLVVILKDTYMCRWTLWTALTARR